MTTFTGTWNMHVCKGCQFINFFFLNGTWIGEYCLKENEGRGREVLGCSLYLNIHFLLLKNTKFNIYKCRQGGIESTRPKHSILKRFFFSSNCCYRLSSSLYRAEMWILLSYSTYWFTVGNICLNMQEIDRLLLHGVLPW